MSRWTWFFIAWGLVALGALALGVVVLINTLVAGVPR